MHEYWYSGNKIESLGLSLLKRNQEMVSGKLGFQNYDNKYNDKFLSFHNNIKSFVVILGTGSSS